MNPDLSLLFLFSPILLHPLHVYLHIACEDTDLNMSWDMGLFAINKVHGPHTVHVFFVQEQLLQQMLTCLASSESSSAGQAFLPQAFFCSMGCCHGG